MIISTARNLKDLEKDSLSTFYACRDYTFKNYITKKQQLLKLYYERKTDKTYVTENKNLYQNILSLSSLSLFLSVEYYCPIERILLFRQYSLSLVLLLPRQQHFAFFSV
jgi:hypothetical protein